MKRKKKFSITIFFFITFIIIVYIFHLNILFCFFFVEIDVKGVRYGSCTKHPNNEGRLILQGFNKIFQKQKDNGYIEMLKDSFNVYKYDLILNISTSETEVASWERFNGFITKSSLLSRSPKIIYKIATIEFPPFVFKSKEKPTSVKYVYYRKETGHYFYGYCIDLIEEIKIRMNFDYELYEPADGKFGSLQMNDSWNGLVKEILDGNADIIVTAFSVMSERENAIDFTTPYYDPVGMTVMIRNTGFEYSITRFLNVLEGSVWGCILTAFVIVSVFLCLFDHYSPFSYQVSLILSYKNIITLSFFSRTIEKLTKMKNACLRYKRVSGFA